MGLTTSDVESLVTVPLEQALNGIQGLDDMRSRSVPQLSSIELIFKPGTDLLRARQLVQERVTAVTPSLPTWAAPPFMMQPLSATSRVMKIGMSSKAMSVTDMSLITYWTIRSRLLSVPGVANVPIWGEQLSQLHVQVVPKQMAEHHVTLDQVMEATAEALDAGILFFSEGHVIGTGGFVDTANQRLVVRHVPAIVGADDLRHVKVAALDGKLVSLGDVAVIEKGHQPLFGDAVVNDGPGLLLVVEKFPWANTLDLTHGVEDALDELRPGLPGLEMDATIFQAANSSSLRTSRMGGASPRVTSRSKSSRGVISVLLVIR